MFSEPTIMAERQSGWCCIR